MRKLVLSFCVLSFAFVCVGGSIALYAVSKLQETLAINENSLITVEKGASINSLARDLERNQVLPSPLAFRLYARIANQTDIKAGEYQINESDTSLSLLKKLVDGEVVDYQLTIVEGWTFSQALKHIQAQPKIRVELSEAEEINAFFREIALKDLHPEGWFFPDTYHYSVGNTDRDILEIAYRRMQETLDREWQSRDVGLPYSRPYEALIMASIVEKETGVPHEREQIAGVFVRRLQKKMRLQTDPTVIYGLGEEFDGNLRRRHLSQTTPYNTYVIHGLPPTPIALPGREAIYAALHPDKGNSYYFVAKGDGSHEFSETLEQHNAAVRRYQLNRSSQYRSTPKPSATPEVTP